MQPTTNGAGTFFKLGGSIVINVGSRGPIKGPVGYRGKAPVGVQGPSPRKLCIFSVFVV